MGFTTKRVYATQEFTSDDARLIMLRKAIRAIENKEKRSDMTLEALRHIREHSQLPNKLMAMGSTKDGNVSFLVFDHEPTGETYTIHKDESGVYIEMEVEEDGK